jgi:hypothetical protein
VWSMRLGLRFVPWPPKKKRPKPVRLRPWTLQLSDRVRRTDGLFVQFAARFVGILSQVMQEFKERGGLANEKAVSR